MRTNYVLIDFENVQPKNVSLLAADHFRVLVFVGQSLSKIPIELAKAMQTLGERGQYIQISGNGSNALDFHIAFYIGRIAAKERETFFHIISKDTGFDPLIAHLKENDIFCKRSASINDIPILRSLSESPSGEQIDGVIDKLKGIAKNRPQKQKTLQSMISAWFGNKLDEKNLERIVAALVKRGVIEIVDSKVRYSLPA